MTVPLLTRLRQQKGWSVRELGRQANVRRAVITKLEQGKQIDTQYHLWRRLAKTLEVSTEELAEGMIPDDLIATPSA